MTRLLGSMTKITLPLAISSLSAHSGTALLNAIGWALLIDEIDKSDLDLPNDLLNIFERGEYSIPELARHAKREAKVTVRASDGIMHEMKMAPYSAVSSLSSS